MNLFWILLIITIFLISSFYWGVRKNTKLAKLVAEKLEKTLKPLDQTYTWLGGSIGFAGEYKVENFKKVYVNLRLIPRQSALWLPISLILGRRDSLQLLFYLNFPVKQEFHIIKKALFMPKIYNIKKLKKIEEGDFVYFYEKDPEQRKIFEHICKELKPIFRHIALTCENHIFYIEFTGNLQNEKIWKGLERLIKEIPLLLCVIPFIFVFSFCII
ncbi:hypothetical protein [Thermodesulfobacterium hydrogeniphilum]|uniref:hypothetical protein n=1 Tax=Thermodesulfobacterium hydrogeniphilum TaxID=161156 RepID=UPI0005701931|nr:hypothetical protein [Thermodesulfobacterium hydrogeniphilum]